jgi:16S rRNA (guanine(1405)-N(7))-methyltransferase
MATDELSQLVDTVLSSAKYRHVAPALVRAIGAQELAKRRNSKEAVKATKNKLHQTVGAYWAGSQEYTQWLAELHTTAGDLAALRTTCRRILQHHASTRERLPLLDDFYSTIFAGLPPIYTVLDLACGLNPLTIPWMPLGPAVTYYACDVDEKQIAFLQEAMPLLGVQGRATVCNLLQPDPFPPADVVLLFKTIPCLEQIDKEIGTQLLARIQAPVIILSYPAQSLGGRNKGMVQSYRERFQLLFQVDEQHIEEYLFPTEIVFRLTREKLI